MTRVVVDTTPVQVLPPNSKRKKWEIQFLPTSVIAGNTGSIMFLGIGHPPGNSTTRNTYDEAMVPGAAVVKNIADGNSRAEVEDAIWLQSDTAGQVVNIREDVGELEV